MAFGAVYFFLLFLVSFAQHQETSNTIQLLLDETLYTGLVVTANIPTSSYLDLSCSATEPQNGTTLYLDFSHCCISCSDALLVQYHHRWLRSESSLYLVRKSRLHDLFHFCEPNGVLVSSLLNDGRCITKAQYKTSKVALGALYSVLMYSMAYTGHTLPWVITNTLFLTLPSLLMVWCP